MSARRLSSGGSRFTDAQSRHVATALFLLASFVLVSAPLAPSARAQSLATMVNVGSGPYGVAYDPSKGEVFVAEYHDDTISVISTNSSGGSSGIPEFLALLEIALLVAVALLVAAFGVVRLSDKVQRPTVAFVLSVIGGAFVMMFGYEVVIEVGGNFGLLGALWGALMIIGSLMLYANPERHATWGVLIIVLSALSWIGALGGGFVGFLLGLIGGILGVTFKLKPVTAPVLPAAQEAHSLGERQSCEW